MDLPEGLGIDLTHRCNQRCSFCWKFVEQSNYEMTFEQVKRFCKYFGYLKPKKLRITGGEPLIHPRFFGVVDLLLEFFERLQVTTNGLLLTEEHFRPRVQYVVTPYTFNQDIIKRFKSKVLVYPRPNGLFDRNHDPDLSESRAKAKHKNCLYKQIRIIGNRVYDCCHAETMERLGRAEDVHIMVGEDINNLFKKDNWKECVHCFVGDKGRKI